MDKRELNDGAYYNLMGNIMFYEGKCQWRDCIHPTFFVGSLRGIIYTVRMDVTVHLCPAHYISCEDYIFKIERYILNAH